MTPSVSQRAVSTAGVIASLLVLWATLLIPGAPGLGYLVAAAVLVLASSTAALCFAHPTRGAVALARAIAAGRR